VEGVVVARVPWGERGLIVRLLTAAEGRVSLVVRKPGGIDAGARLSAEVARGRGELATVRTFEVLDARLRLAGRYGAFTAAMYACELCGALARDGHPEPRLYGLLETCLLVLDAADGDPGSAFIPALEAKALTFAGVGPVLDRCVGCGGGVEDAMVFATELGGVAHARCARGQVMTGEFVRALEAGRRTPLVDVLDRRLPRGPAGVLYDAVTHHLGRGLAARGVVAG
jgi:DNA repair protein RecO (recombination protein O)